MLEFYLQDDQGAYLVDRDPRYFPPVLNYLRSGKLIIDSNLSEEGILAEAEFYSLSSLVQILKEKIKAKTNRVWMHVFRSEKANPINFTNE